jgi:ribosome-binding protein aMBF1 (putative translation factor)
VGVDVSSYKQETSHKERRMTKDTNCPICGTPMHYEPVKINQSELKWCDKCKSVRKGEHPHSKIAQAELVRVVHSFRGGANYVATKKDRDDLAQAIIKHLEGV